MKVLFIAGTRPDAIKLIPVVRLAKKDPRFQAVFCLTSQHRQMLMPVLKFFGIKADFDFNLMKHNQGLSEFTSRAFKRLGKLIRDQKPDFVVIQGDTTTSFVGAMAAFYNKVMVAHIEAGLRTYNKFAPFPEEINRVIIARVTDLHLAPTLMAKKNLLREGVQSGKIIVTGNTGVDALLLAKKIIAGKSSLLLKRIPGIDFKRKIVLITGHRRESFGGPFNQICMGLKRLAARFPDVEFIYPVHLNPNVREPVYRILRGISNIHLLKPLDYPDFVRLMDKAYMIITDSGGIQEEAPSLGKPVLVMRKVTERMEGIKAGVVKLTGANQDKIFTEASRLLTDKSHYKKMAKVVNLYGDGKASQRILKAILNRDS